jgi:hypothetical protein
LVHSLEDQGHWFFFKGVEGVWKGKKMRCNALISSTCWVCAALEEFQLENTQNQLPPHSLHAATIGLVTGTTLGFFNTYGALLFFSAFLFAFWKYMWCCFMCVTVTMISQPHVSDIKWNLPSWVEDSSSWVLITCFFTFYPISDTDDVPIMIGPKGFAISSLSPFCLLSSQFHSFVGGLAKQ